MKKLAAVLFSIGLAFAVCFEGSFFHLIVLIAGAMYVVAPAVVMAGAIGFWSWFRHVKRPWITTCWAIIGIAIGAGLVSGGVGLAIHQWRESQTRSFVARAVAFLEAEHARTGTYPSSLPESQFGERPKWLGRPDSCSLGPDGYRFEYWDPASMMVDGYEFTSTKRQWTYFD